MKNNGKSKNKNDPLKLREDCQHHLGLGAAVHLSSPGEPALSLFKHYGVIESTAKSAISPTLFRALKQGNVNPSVLFKEVVHPWCRRKNAAKHVHLLSQHEQDIILRSIPGVVKANPGRYPFLYPAFPHTNRNSGGRSSSGSTNSSSSSNSNGSTPW